MSEAEAPRPALLVAAALLLLLPLLPPEVQGVSAAGCAALIALGAAVSLNAAVLVVPVLLLGVAAWPLSLASLAPGTTPWAIAVPVLAVAAAATGRAAGPRAGRVVPAILGGIGALAGGHALWQVAWGLDAAADTLAASGSADPVVQLALARLAEGRAFAAFATPAALGCFLVIALPVTLAQATRTRGSGRLAYAVAALLQVAGLAATQSATALGAFVAGGVLFALGRGLSGKVTLGALLVLGALLGGVLFLRRDSLLDPKAPQGSWHLRVQNAEVAAHMIGAHPVRGVGPGAFAEVVPAFLGVDGNEVRHAHDLPLELTAELGIPLGLLATAAFAVVFLGPVLRVRRKDPSWQQGAALGLAAFAIQNLADFTAFFPSLLWIACLIRGALGAGDVDGASLPAPRWTQGAARLTVALAAVVVAASGLSVDARRQAADDGDAARSLRLARRAAVLAPWDPDARLLHGAVLARTPQSMVAASRETERALALAPVRPAAHAQRARIRAALGDLPGAYADMVRAAELFPTRAVYAREAEALSRKLTLAYPGRE